MKKLIIFTVLAVVLAAGIAQAGSVTFAWNAVSGAAGYKIYVGTATKVYTKTYDVGNVTSYTVSIPAGAWVAAATAYDNNKLESDYSNELSGLILTPPTSFKIVVP